MGDEKKDIIKYYKTVEYSMNERYNKDIFYLRKWTNTSFSPLSAHLKANISSQKTIFGHFGFILEKGKLEVRNLCFYVYVLNKRFNCPSLRIRSFAVRYL